MKNWEPKVTRTCAVLSDPRENIVEEGSVDDVEWVGIEGKQRGGRSEQQTCNTQQQERTGGGRRGEGRREKNNTSKVLGGDYFFRRSFSWCWSKSRSWMDGQMDGWDKVVCAVCELNWADVTNPKQAGRRVMLVACKYDTIIL